MYKFYNVPYEIELGNVGSSHGLYGFKYDVVPDISTFNFALSSQPYFYDYAVLNKYINHFKKNAIVLIPVSYFEIIGRPDYSLYRKRYYRILPRKAMDYWNFKEYIYYAKLPIISAGINRNKILYDISDVELSPYHNRNMIIDEEEIFEYCYNKHKSWVENDNEYINTGYVLNIQEVSKIIDLCYENNLRPIIITLPVTDVLNSMYSDSFFEVFSQFYQDLSNKYPKLLCLDYSRNETFSNNHELFYDGDHLNNAGAELFTKTLISDLRDKELLNY